MHGVEHFQSGPPTAHMVQPSDTVWQSGTLFNISCIFSLMLVGVCEVTVTFVSPATVIVPRLSKLTTAITSNRVLDTILQPMKAHLLLN
jgi:hypothetical protein